MFTNNGGKGLSLTIVNLFLILVKITSTKVGKPLTKMLNLGIIALLGFSLNSQAALSATSANTIQGSKPTFTNTSGANRFGFEVGGTTYSQGIGNINSSDIKEFDAGLRLGDFHVISLGVSDFNASTDYYDAEGDAAHPTTPFSMGTMTKKWYENGSSTPISDMNKTLGCGSNLSLPLKLKIEIPNVQVHSRYGDPKDSGLTTLTKEYKIGTASGICFARPNQMAVYPQYAWVGKNSGTWAWNGSSGSAIDSTLGGGYSSDFVVVKNASGTVIDGGFSPNANPKFPTTGFPKAQFSLVMTSNATDYNFNSNGGSAVTVDTNGKVTLNSKPTGPVTITATLKANTSKVHTYTFDPRTVWVRPTGTSSYGDYAWAKTQCGGESKIPSRAQLTNSPQKTATSSNWQSNNYFTRAIDGSLFSEWGWTDSTTYPGSQWDSGGYYYWTRDA
ncbi:hypothetical protein RCS94_08290 [Orbaceae bacterium ac157xtp]